MRNQIIGKAALVVSLMLCTTACTEYVEAPPPPRHYYHPAPPPPPPPPQWGGYPPPPPPHWHAYPPPPPPPGDYYYEAERDYRPGPQYQERVVAPSEHIYRGGDGRYYCHRGDGTTGLIVGAAAGGIFGDLITRGHSQVLGTLLGAGGGALLGQSIDRNSVHCR